MTTKNILIGCTGSVAALKLPILVDKLIKLSSDECKINIKIIVTEKAKLFFDRKDISESVPLLDDSFEWNSWKARGDPVIHIDLGKWADVLIIAPLDANSLAKIANGLCDNLLLCTTRAWDMTKPLYFCPAMNTKMYEHPITSQHIETLKSWGHTEIPTISKTLICGDTGLGAMAEVDTILNVVKTQILLINNE